MTQDDVAQALVEAMQMVTGTNWPRPQLADRLDSYGIDSLSALEVVMLCESRLQVFLVDSGINGLITVGDLVQAFLSGEPYR